MDIWGVDGAAAEAEALAAMVSFMESVGLTSDDVGIKVNSRAVLAELLARTCGVDAAADAARFAACCVLVDKLEKVPPEALHGDFGALGVAAADVDALAAVLRDAADAGGSLAALEALLGDGPALSHLRALVDLAEAGGFGDWFRRHPRRPSSDQQPCDLWVGGCPSAFRGQSVPRCGVIERPDE